MGPMCLVSNPVLICRCRTAHAMLAAIAGAQARQRFLTSKLCTTNGLLQLSDGTSCCAMQDEEERKAKFQEIIDSTFADKAKFIEKVLTAQPGPYILGDTPSYADWHMFGYVAQFMAGMFGIPATLWDKHPAVVEFRRTMAARDDVQQYYKQFEGDDEYMGQRIGFMP